MLQCKIVVSQKTILFRAANVDEQYLSAVVPIDGLLFVKYKDELLTIQCGREPFKTFYITGEAAVQLVDALDLLINNPRNFTRTEIVYEFEEGYD